MTAIGLHRIYLLVSIALLSCGQSDSNVVVPPEWLQSNPQFISDGFNYPVGAPDGSGYYNAQGFGQNDHLGDDWNGIGGGNSDLGDPIYAIANGRVVQAIDLKGGWGNIIRIIHAIPKGDSLIQVESLHAHCDSIMVTEGHGIIQGEQIGTIGNAHGQYLAHLHFEIRDEVGMELGPGYSKDQRGYLDPTAFLKQH